jgi:hypothetical protein
LVAGGDGSKGTFPGCTDWKCGSYHILGARVERIPLIVIRDACFTSKSTVGRRLSPPSQEHKALPAIRVMVVDAAREQRMNGGRVARKVTTVCLGSDVKKATIKWAGRWPHEASMFGDQQSSTARAKFNAVFTVVHTLRTAPACESFTRAPSRTTPH